MNSTGNIIQYFFLGAVTVSFAYQNSRMLLWHYCDREKEIKEQAIRVKSTKELYLYTFSAMVITFGYIFYLFYKGYVNLSFTCFYVVIVLFDFYMETSAIKKDIEFNRFVYIFEKFCCAVNLVLTFYVIVKIIV
jgi:hypothetical protein